MIKLLTLIVTASLLAGCYNDNDPVHPWRCAGRNGEFFMPLDRFVEAAFVPLRTECRAEAVEVLGDAQAVLVSAEWVAAHSASPLPSGTEPWYLVRGLHYGDPANYQVRWENTLHLLYVYAATPKAGIEAPYSPAGAQAAPVAVQLPLLPRQVFCAAQLVPAAFYTCTGYRDWWRFPLEYPYQMLMIDTFEAGNLAQYNPAYLIDDPNQSSTVILPDVIRIARQKEFVALQTKAGRRALLFYQTGEVINFASEAELTGHLKTRDQYSAPLYWQDMDTCYREFESAL